MRPHRFAVATLFASLATAASAQTVLVRGGGSSFAAPLFDAWTKIYPAPAGVGVVYESIGSGEGVSRFLTGSLDFAATDAPLTPEQERAAPGPVAHIPVASGMMAIVYSLPDGRAGDLRLPRDVYGDIFAGVIRHWDDPRIAKANPELTLPHRDIRIVGRLDRSGTTFAFTTHLETVSAGWRASGEGAATAVDWPGAAMQARGNEGVAAQVLRTDGAIGYVEYGFASRLGLPLATLENASGDWVKPGPASGMAAIGAAEIPDDLKIQAPEPQQPGAFPIVTFTWALLHHDAASDARRDAARSFIAWAVDEGQGKAAELGYAPLDEEVSRRAGAVLAALP
jgi:phosphate transport system substrate-binding protein